jgi:hypothetical protein
MVMQTMRARFIVLLLVFAASIGQTMPSPASAQTDASASEWRVATPPTSKAISLGTFRSTFAVFDALDAAGVHVGEMAADACIDPHAPSARRGRACSSWRCLLRLRDTPRANYFFDTDDVTPT